MWQSLLCVIIDVFCLESLICSLGWILEGVMIPMGVRLALQGSMYENHLKSVWCVFLFFFCYVMCGIECCCMMHSGVL